TARGLPSILIPFPFSTGGHQEENARFLERRGASIMILDSELSSSKKMKIYSQ
ncbi:MAG: glycosyltransferase, partial [Promethearchaeota archaeon]